MLCWEETNDCYKYNIAAGSWSQIPTTEATLRPRSVFGLAPVKGGIIIMGGEVRVRVMVRVRVRVMVKVRVRVRVRIRVNIKVRVRVGIRVNIIPLDPSFAQMRCQKGGKCMYA